ncbi:MAG: hypothetical protein AAFN93_29000 [Bacteroidota bacterium]
MAVLQKKWPDDFHQFRSIFHFFFDLSNLLEKDLVDKQLAISLFQTRVQKWFDLMKSFDYSQYGKDLQVEEDNDFYRKIFELPSRLEVAGFDYRLFETNSLEKQSEMKEFEKHLRTIKKKNKNH